MCMWSDTGGRRALGPNGRGSEVTEALVSHSDGAEMIHWHCSLLACACVYAAAERSEAGTRVASGTRPLELTGAAYWSALATRAATSFLSTAARASPNRSQSAFITVPVALFPRVSSPATISSMMACTASGVGAAGM